MRAVSPPRPKKYPRTNRGKEADPFPMHQYQGQYRKDDNDEEDDG